MSPSLPFALAAAATTKRFARAIQANPRFSVLYALQAGMLGLGGRFEEAKAVARRLIELEPAFRVGLFIAFAHFVDPQLRDAVAVGIRRAGVPE